MNFINSRQERDFSIFAVIILLMTAVFISFGATNSSANPNNNQIRPENNLRPRNSRLGRILDRKELGRIGSTGINQTSLFSTKVKSFSEVLLTGDLDTTFGTGGKVVTPVGSGLNGAFAIALQSDGKFVAAGSSYNGTRDNFTLVRYNSNGSLDATFGTGGKLTTDFGSGDSESFAVAIQPADGKIIAAGDALNGNNDDFALVRYNSNGTLDTTFGTGGIVTTNFGNSSEYINAIALQSDGKIVAVGVIDDGSFYHFALARYNSDGTLDTMFGTGGKVTTAFTTFDDMAHSVALQTDGKIVVAGEANADFVVARYNTNGTLDATFGSGGKAITSINTYDSANSVILQPDGKIIAAGEEGDGTNSDFGLTRYTANGALDTTFGNGGIVTTAIGASDEFASSVALQTSGKIIAGGFSFNGRNDDFALVRYNSDGSLDSSFGAGGKVTTDFGSTSFDDISAIAIQSGNRVIAVGYADSSSGTSSFAAAAYSLETANNCSYTLSPNTANLSVGGGTSNFGVTTTAGCSYTAVSNDSFITITAGGSGSGSGTVSFSVATSSAARTGTITVGGQTFTVNQISTVRRKKTLLSPANAPAGN